MVTWIGWGEYQPSVRPAKLQEANVPIISNDECETNFDFEILPIFEQSICTGYLEGGVSICGGDSGSPLLIRTPNNFYIHLGVAYVTVFPCGDGPSAYISTGFFTDWIFEQLEDSSSDVKVA